MEELLKVGYGRAEITPDEPVNLTGYGNDALRVAETFRDKLYATCIAFTGTDGTTALLYTTDTTATYASVTGPVRQKIADELGLPIENIHVASTHTHSAPSVTMENPAIEGYRRKYSDGLLQAGREALEDRTEAYIYVGNTNTENMNFVRHYKMADGTFAGANFGSFKAGCVGHTSQPDTSVQVIKFVRPGTKDVVLMNFQAHPCFTGGMDKRVLSADYIGDLRTYVETKTGARFAFFQGAAGNLNGVSYVAHENRTSDSAEYGRILGEYALKALTCTRSVTGDMTVAIGSRELELELDHSDDNLLEQAEELWKEWRETFDRPACNAKAKAMGQNSIYAVGHIISRSKREKTEKMTIYALRVGPLAFVCAPYEMFCQSGMTIKEWAPYSMTFIVQMCNDYRNYFATRLAFSHGCYEVDTRRYACGTAEMVTDRYLELLTEIKKN